jgi:hypothetical protein
VNIDDMPVSVIRHVQLADPAVLRQLSVVSAMLADEVDVA